MKKLMKALAFATVACMLLSTAAFAENSAEMDAGAKSVTVTIDGVTASTPISIVVTPTTVTKAEEIASGNILYINQDVTDENGDVTFESVDTKNTNGVNVFLGYEGVGESALTLVAEALVLEPQDKVTIVPAKIYKASEVDATVDGIENTESDFGVGAAVDLTKSAFGEDREIKDMIWSISYTKDGEAKKAFTKVKPALIENLNACEGTLRLGLTVSAGSKAKDDTVETAAEITAVNVIVKTNNAANTEEKIIFTDASDEVLEEGYVAPAEPDAAE